MAIKSSTFSGWRLSGKDADAFRSQLKNATPNQKAKSTLSRGRKLMSQYDELGHVILRPKKNNQKS